MRRFCTRVVVVALVGAASLGVVALGPGTAEAQSLADVARAEEARRKIAPKATKTYTNQDLRPDGRPSQPAPSTPAATSPTVEPTPTPEAAEKKSEPPRDEKYWRARIFGARERLDRTKLFAEALQSRVNALTTDFVNRDDPAQRAVIGQERQKALDEIARVQKEIQELTRAIADIEEEARRAGVPPGWLR
jgi:hypothetical protein